MDRRREIQEETGRRGEKVAILDQLESEVRRVVGELVRSRDETARLRNRVAELEGMVGSEHAGGGELERLTEENRRLLAKIELIEGKAREVLKKLEVIKQG